MNMLGNPGFSLFGVWEVKWYGVIMASAMLIGVVVAVLICKMKKYHLDMPLELALIVLPLAVIGARLYFVIFYGVDSFVDVFKIWEGGLAIYGGVIGGFVGILLYCWLRKDNIAKVCDVAAPCLILGQAIGRWGNFVNQEAYGGVVSNAVQQWFPFSVFIESDGLWHYATFFYESMWNILGFVGLMLIIRFVRQKGVVTAVYFIYYGIGRALIEGLRTDSLYLWNTSIRVSQALSIALIALGVSMLIYIFVKDRKNRKANKI